MAQYLLSVHGRSDDPTPTDEEMQQVFADVDAFNKRVQDAGAWVFAGGLEAIDTATVVDGTGTDVVTTDGPFSEAKEFLGGFWVIEAADLDKALEWAAAGSKACQGKVEVRPFQSE